jgi:hypothetical protein
MIAHHPVPDCYLVAIREEVAGWIAHESTSWMAPECFLISFSESNLHQEAMLLMPPFAWVAGSAGVVVLQPDTRNPASAQLRRADG